MKDCFKVLEIPRTKDRQAVKRAYREVVKKYHPDTVRSPEKIRHYTIKCAEINDAYHQAIEYCATGEDVIVSASRRFPKGRESGRPWQVISTWITIGIMLFLMSVWAEILFGFRFGRLNLVGVSFPHWLTSLPPESPARIMISGLLAIPLGILFGGVLSLFTTLPAIYLVALLENTSFSRYSFKVAWMSVTIVNFITVYHTGFHWPFEHQSSGYYTFLYHLCRVVAWAYIPIYGLVLWIKENRQYMKVKADVLNTLPSLASIRADST